MKKVNNCTQTFEYFQDDPTIINELRQDVRDEGSKFGEVKNVKIFDVSVSYYMLGMS